MFNFSKIWYIVIDTMVRLITVLIGVIFMFSFITSIFNRKKMTERKPATELSPSAKAYELIKEFEGLRLKAYQCSAKKWTIGYGSTRYRDGKPVKPTDTIPDEKTAQDMLDYHVVNSVCPDINKYVTVPLKQTEYDALCSFIYNTGVTGLYGYFKDNGKLVKRHSSLARKLNAGDYEGAANGLLAWVYADGKKSPGLERRRQAERALFLS